ncbi:LAFE_0B05358g1_1 [Lachancea fermentati]|uniref:LAFE_0B05358g1_1 n=1 Tax=Lachancea fermentati TaxID=4955 RepID=A0A1G4M7U6_LACFM|nr:LAFE_0B05358g1_1 [Lachancea fermentati]
MNRAICRPARDVGRSKLHDSRAHVNCPSCACRDTGCATARTHAAQRRKKRQRTTLRRQLEDTLAGRHWSCHSPRTLHSLARHRPRATVSRDIRVTPISRSFCAFQLFLAVRPDPMLQLQLCISLHTRRAPAEPERWESRGHSPSGAFEHPCGGPTPLEQVE